MEGQDEAPKQQLSLEFVLILASEYRIILERECRAAKRGKSRKLNNKDKEAIAEKVQLMRFHPERYLQESMEAMLPSGLLDDDVKKVESEIVEGEIPADAKEVKLEELMQATADFREKAVEAVEVIGRENPEDLAKESDLAPKVLDEAF